MSTATRLDPVTLQGRFVRLEPLSADHVPGLAQVALDPDLWRWTIARPTTETDVLAWAKTTIEARERGEELPFATIDVATGRPIGSSRYMNIVPEHRRLEIGWTWVARAWQRTGTNREAKFLMLEHAFETLGLLQHHRRGMATGTRIPRGRARSVSTRSRRDSAIIAPTAAEGGVSWSS